MVSYVQPSKWITDASKQDHSSFVYLCWLQSFYYRDFFPFWKSPAFSNGWAQEITDSLFQLQHHPVETSGKADDTRVFWFFWWEQWGSGCLWSCPTVLRGPSIPCVPQFTWVGHVITGTSCSICLRLVWFMTARSLIWLVLVALRRTESVIWITIVNPSCEGGISVANLVFPAKKNLCAPVAVTKLQPSKRMERRRLAGESFFPPHPGSK